MIRTHDAGALRADHVGQTVTLAGWVARRRDHGGVAFLDLREASGVVQVVVRDEAVAHSLRSEYCVQVAGSAAVCSPLRMSLTSWPPSRPVNQTYGMPRRSAYRICLPNFWALAATSQGTPFARSACAMASLAGRLSSSLSATSTTLGTLRSVLSSPRLISGTSDREIPNEMPTPG